MSPDLCDRNARHPSSAVIIAATALVSAPIIALSQFISHARIDEYDKWLFAYYGRRLLDGAELYSDLWDNKPPGIFWVNAVGLWLGGDSQIGVYALCVLAVCATAVVFFIASRQLYGAPVAGIATCLAVLYLNDWRFHVGCNRPNTFFVLTELACFALYCRAIVASSNVNRTLFVAGMCGAIGVCFKQTALAATLAVLLHTALLAVTGHINWQAAVRRALWFAAGWIAPVGLVIILLILTADAGWAWHAIVTFNRLYFLPGAGSAVVPYLSWVEEHLRAFGLPLVLATATLVHAAFTLRRRQKPGHSESAPQGQPPALLALLWIWMLVSIYLAAVGPHQRAPYLAVALPPLVSLAAYAVQLLIASGRTSERKPAFFVIVGVVWFAYMIVPALFGQIDMAARQHYHAYDAPPDLAVQRNLDAITAVTAPGDSIFVFGYDPQLYWQAGRANAIRYIGTEKVHQLADNGQPLFDEIVADLKRARPKAILLDATSSSKSATIGQLDVSDFDRWLHAEYRQPDAENLPLLWTLR